MTFDPPEFPRLGMGRATGLAAAFLGSGLLFSLGAGGALALVLDVPAPAPSGITTAMVILQTGAILLGYGLATWLVGFRIAGLGPDQLRWRPGGLAGFGRGFLIGGAPALVVLGLAVPAAGAGWSVETGGLGGWVESVGRLGALLGPAAFAEEIIFRGVALVLLAAAFGRATAVVGLAVLFGLAHLLNPDVTPLAVGNIALAGVFLGTVFYLPGGLWTATGAHIGWNLTLAALAAPVSGLPLPVAGLDYHPGGPIWLTGGGFGPEGGLLATVALGAVTLVAARMTESGRGG